MQVRFLEGFDKAIEMIQGGASFAEAARFLHEQNRLRVKVESTAQGLRRHCAAHGIRRGQDRPAGDRAWALDAAQKRLRKVQDMLAEGEDALEIGRELRLARELFKTASEGGLPVAAERWSEEEVEEALEELWEGLDTEDRISLRRFLCFAYDEYPDEHILAGWLDEMSEAEIAVLRDSLVERGLDDCAARVDRLVLKLDKVQR